jgi:hypothetical protein
LKEHHFVFVEDIGFWGRGGHVRAAGLKRCDANRCAGGGFYEIKTGYHGRGNSE